MFLLLFPWVPCCGSSEIISTQERKSVRLRGGKSKRGFDRVRCKRIGGIAFGITSLISKEKVSSRFKL
jgi:hypothetical protein